MRISDLSSDVCSSDLALALFGCLVDVGEIDRSAAAALRQNLRNRRGQRGLAMVDVTDGADVAVRRSAERRVGKECVSTSRSRGSPYPKKNTPKNTMHTE